MSQNLPTNYVFITNGESNYTDTTSTKQPNATLAIRDKQISVSPKVVPRGGQITYTTYIVFQPKMHKLQQKYEEISDKQKLKYIL